ncbi:MAG: DUF4434 domain-containing protein [Bacteroidales bacterium]|nr:DUF4434 domain-containing protein [Bacteroidales bacterium]MBN2820990.1 DUF4434 domain-containing protein [Bacteroidales bacterium]
MKTIKNLFFIVLSLSLMMSCKTTEKKDAKGPVKVELKQLEEGKYRLFVDGDEFFVKGAGCEFGKIEALGEHGANSFRTWRTENGQQDAIEVLDRAQESGLLVLMGLEVGRQRHGHDYGDTAWVNEQFEYLKGEVMRLKDHPALLGWAIGNELNLRTEDWRVYDAVNDISKMIHEIDPNHVTTTTTAGIGKTEVDEIKQRCTDIDFLSIQMYGDIVNLQQRIADTGWDGPYMVTEWGATGHWEVPSTPWGANIEQTSKEKAEAFIHRYKVAIEADKDNCLGSYVFLWGQKQERTPTWYGMFLENGDETETVDAMHYLWTGKWPENRCPTLDSFRLNGLTAYDFIKLKEEDKLNAVVYARDYENDTLAYTWEIMPESTDLGDGGDFENRPNTVLTYKGTENEVFDLPETPGAYRIFIYVQDSHKNAATANIPFFVEE